CKRCRELVDKFNQGMVDTAKKNFGGGNTAWEEKSLSKYESSEVRLMEIVESLCESSDFECNRLVEEHEEQLEAWWLRRKKEHPDLFEWFCVKTLKVCCPPGTYGPDCLACQGGSESDEPRQLRASMCVCVSDEPRQLRASAQGTGLRRALLSDVDECSLPEKPCLRTHENCYNTPGSYVCVCPDGFEETEDACVQAPQPAGAEVTEESPTQPPSREDL
ncbi:PREDICTED: cysteine-rich with EGF-like domain protein 2, partial [Myotis davidii]|uniref:cysteine-rich with EGF-like domain protein 2 n=1 Tax=Myotis davidii TaxID=225400 RepID=UPI0007678858